MNVVVRQRIALALTLTAAAVGVFLAGPLMMPFVVALLFALVLRPLHDKLVAWRFSASASAVMVTAVTVVLTLVVIVGLAPLIFQDGARLFSTLADSSRSLIDYARGLLESAPDAFVDRLPETDQLLDGLQGKDGAERSLGLLQPIFGTAASIGGGVATGLMFALLVPIALFFFLYCGETFAARAIDLLPKPYQTDAHELLERMGRSLQGYLQGQGIVCVAQGTIHAVGLTLIGLQFGWLIGLLTGLSALVPVIGNTIMLSVALLVAVVQFDSLLLILAVPALYAVAQLLETLFLVPVLVGQQIEVHPLAMIVAVLLGGQLFGLVGALLALPGTAVLTAGLRFFWERYRESDTYGDRLERDEAA